jgi:hypothetical protein
VVSAADPLLVNQKEKINTFVRFEVFTVVTMKNGVFWDVTPCGSCKNGRFGVTWRLIIRVTRIGELGTTLPIFSQRASVASYS